MNKIAIKIIRILGWVLFIVSLFFALISLFGLTVEVSALSIGLIVFFLAPAAAGFMLTRYKKEKSINKSEENSPLKSPPDKIAEIKENKETVSLKFQSTAKMESEDTDMTPDIVAYLRKKAGIKENGDIFYLEYFDANDTPTDRYIEIQHLVRKKGHTYLNAYCHTAHEIRLFCLDRIVSLSFQGEKIEDLQEFIKNIPVNISNLKQLKE
jgi:hypothetical protein